MHDAFSLFLCGQPGPQRHEARPNTDALNQGVPVTRIARMQPLSMVNRNQIEIDTVEESAGQLQRLQITSGLGV